MKTIQILSLVALSLGFLATSQAMQKVCNNSRDNIRIQASYQPSLRGGAMTSTHILASNSCKEIPLGASIAVYTGAEAFAAASAPMRARVGVAGPVSSQEIRVGLGGRLPSAGVIS